MDDGGQKAIECITQKVEARLHINIDIGIVKLITIVRGRREESNQWKDLFNRYW